MQNKIIVISGPTASGKSSLALKLAQKFHGVIINADSMQIYQQIPIITAQPSLESIIAEHFLYGALPVTTVCSVGLYLPLAQKIIKEALERDKIPIIVGGTGLYLKSLIYGLAEISNIDPNIRLMVRNLYQEIGATKFYQLLAKHDPKSASILNINDKQRVIRAYEVIMQTGKSLLYWQEQQHKQEFSKESYLQIGLVPNRLALYQNINQRFMTMIENNVIEEVKKLNHITLDDNLPARRAHGVRELTAYLKQEISLEEAIKKSQQITRNYAKRQVTWIKHQMNEMHQLQHYHYIDEVIADCEKLVADFLFS